MRSLNNKWIMVGAIWVGVVLFSFFNFNEIKKLKEDTLAKEVQEMDRQFIFRNMDRITKVINHQAQLSHSIDSMGIGVLMVESRLLHLAEATHLDDVRLEAKAEDNSGDRIPLKLFVTGAVPDVLFFMAKLRQDTPYLTVTAVDWTNLSNGRAAHFTLMLNYSFAIEESGADV